MGKVKDGAGEARHIGIAGGIYGDRISNVAIVPAEQRRVSQCAGGGINHGNESHTFIHVRKTDRRRNRIARRHCRKVSRERLAGQICKIGWPECNRVAQIFRCAAQTSRIGHSRRSYINFREEGGSGDAARVNLCAVRWEIGGSGRTCDEHLVASTKGYSSRAIAEEDCTTYAAASQICGEHQ